MTSTDTRDGFDAVVLGAGEAGTIVASLAVESGLTVALVYREPWGSTCLNVGCVPSKFLIHRARVAHLPSATTAPFSSRIPMGYLPRSRSLSLTNMLIVHKGASGPETPSTPVGVESA
jgi:choline dehydrogenase-like flavoprotein